MIVDISKQMWDEIASDLRKTRAPSRTAKNLGYSIQTVLQVHEAENQPRTVREEKFGGMGRPEVLSFVVARKRVTDPWDNVSPPIARARADYEAGTHDMLTGYDGEYAILYSIPLKKAVPRPGYFLPENMA